MLLSASWGSCMTGCGWLRCNEVLTSLHLRSYLQTKGNDMTFFTSRPWEQIHWWLEATHPLTPGMTKITRIGDGKVTFIVQLSYRLRRALGVSHQVPAASCLGLSRGRYCHAGVCPLRAETPPKPHIGHQNRNDVSILSLASRQLF